MMEHSDSRHRCVVHCCQTPNQLIILGVTDTSGQMLKYGQIFQTVLGLTRPWPLGSQYTHREALSCAYMRHIMPTSAITALGSDPWVVTIPNMSGCHAVTSTFPRAVQGGCVELSLTTTRLPLVRVEHPPYAVVLAPLGGC